MEIVSFDIISIWSNVCFAKELAEQRLIMAVDEADWHPKYGGICQKTSRTHWTYWKEENGNAQPKENIKPWNYAINCK